MHSKKLEDIELYFFDNLSSLSNINHFVSSRKGGFSEDGFQGLNTGFNLGDDTDKVLKNRHIISRAVGLSLDTFVFANQCHTSNLQIIRSTEAGCGAKDIKTGINNTDGLITRYTDICISVQVADCVPILLYDSKNKVIAAIHAGWKGTIAQIAGKAIDKLKENFGSNPSNIYAGIGPSIGPCCYEVGQDVYFEYQRLGFSVPDVIKPSGQKEKYFFDLWAANKSQLTASGVDPWKIETASICTKCNSDKFFSVRAAGGDTGRFTAGIMLKG